MPNSKIGRERVLQYLEKNSIDFVDLAVMYGMTKQDVTNYLKGNLIENPKAKQLLVRIISDFKIR